MSGTLPTTQAPASVTFRSIAPTLVSVSHSLKRQVRSRGGQRWGMQLVYGKMTREVFAPLWAFIIKQRSQYETFQTVVAGFTSPLGTWPGTPVVNGAVAAGNRSVAIDGVTAGQTGIAKAGDWIKFNSHAKVYQVTSDANSNGSGQATLTIEPALVSAIADNETFVTSSVPFTVALTSDQQNFPIAPPVIIEGFTIDLIEAT